MIFTESLLYSWGKNGDYASRLVADVPDDRMAHQPAAAMNHPAWVLCHLNIYHPVIVALLRGQTFDDPKGHQFGMQSKPVADGSVYPAKNELIGAFTRGHDEVAQALRAADPSALDADMSLERWKPVMPKVGIALGYLMFLHESIHLGQISVWRRVQGLPSV